MTNPARPPYTWAETRDCIPLTIELPSIHLQPSGSGSGTHFPFTARAGHPPTAYALDLELIHKTKTEVERLSWTVYGRQVDVVLDKADRGLWKRLLRCGRAAVN